MFDFIFSTWIGGMLLGGYIVGFLFLLHEQNIADNTNVMDTLAEIGVALVWFLPKGYLFIKWILGLFKGKAALFALMALPAIAMATGSPEISLSEAFAYCFSQPSYVWTVISGTVLGLAFIVFAIKLQQNEDFTMKHIGLIAVGVIMILACWLARPTKVKANTTPEQAARGVYIG